MIRRLATSILVSTFRAPERQAVAAGADPAAAGSAQPPKVNRALRFVGRQVGRLLTPRAKARIQDYLINRYRIPMHLVPAEALQQQFRRALERLTRRDGAGALGDHLEFGVYQGTSLIAMHRALGEAGIEGMRLFGFDSFAGLPATADAEGVWSAGQYRAEVEFTRDRLTAAGIDWDRTFLVKGFFSETLTEETRRRYGIEHASTIMLDCDLYSSTREALDWCAPLIRGEAVLLFDDWNSTGEGQGQKRAFAEFLAAHPELEAREFGAYSEKSQIFLLAPARRPARSAKRRRGRTGQPR